MSSWQKVRRSVLSVVPFGVLLVAFYLHVGNYPFWGVQSEHDIYNLPLKHPLLWGRFYSHTKHDHHKEKGALQSTRLEQIRTVGSAALKAFEAMEFPVFLTSGTLLGFYRHGDAEQPGFLPWEDDFDVAWLASECEKFTGGDDRRFYEFFKKHVDLERFEISSNKLSCHGIPNSKGQVGLAGRLNDKVTGLHVDMYAYSPVPASHPYAVQYRQANPEWLLQTDMDSPRYYYGLTALMPLQKTTFLGHAVHVPNNIPHWLFCQYGPFLDVHLHWWGLAAYVKPSLISLALGAVLAVKTRSLGLACSLGFALARFGAGTRLLYLLAVSVLALLLILRTGKSTYFPLKRKSLAVAAAFTTCLLIDLFLMSRALPFMHTISSPEALKLNL